MPHLYPHSFKSVSTLIFPALLATVLGTGVRAEGSGSGPRFEISFPASVHSLPITGRLFVMISRTSEPEPRLQSTWLNSPEIVAVDVTQLNADHGVVVDATAPGTPLRNLDDVPPGDYFVQAVLNVYTRFQRADGRVLWAHMDRGEGQQFNLAPGNLYSKVQHLHLDRAGSHRLSLTEVIPVASVPADTQWVKHLRMQSQLLTAFWGRPIYLDAIVLLPRDYTAHPDAHYPVIYIQPEHSRRSPPFEFATAPPVEGDSESQMRASVGYESGYAFQQSWQSEKFPRMIAVSILTPTPLADWSGAMDSANNGPYGKAIVSELIPLIETQFRIIREPFARVLTGRASGGRAALALQLFHPEFFGGVWVFRPWPFSFRDYFSLDIYEHDNAFTLGPTDLPEFARNPSDWLQFARGYARTTTGTPFVNFAENSQHDLVMAGMAGGDCIGADDAILGPVADNGFPKPLWNRRTGAIDRGVADYWREHSDLVYYTEKNWSALGPLLVGKLHFYVDELDEFYRNFGVHRFEASLRAQHPHYDVAFSYSTGTSHQGGWQPLTNAQLVRLMADHIAARAPNSVDTAAWHD